MLIDTHCHLDAAEFDADRDDVASAAFAAGLTGIVVPAVAASNFSNVAEICSRYRGCAPAYGIHPMYVASATHFDLEQLAMALSSDLPVAVGEIGLDRFVEPRDDARQDYFFTEQLKLARAAGLPVLLHVRRAVDEVLKRLRKTRVPGGIAHAFNGSRQQADEFIKLGFKLGFGGAMTFTGSSRIRELARSLPLESIVLETDSPDIPPSWLNGGRNTPTELPRIAEMLAEIRGVSCSEIVSQTHANALAVLPRLANFFAHGTS